MNDAIKAHLRLLGFASTSTSPYKITVRTHEARPPTQCEKRARGRPKKRR